MGMPGCVIIASLKFPDLRLLNRQFVVSPDTGNDGDGMVRGRWPVTCNEKGMNADAIVCGG